LALAAPSAVRYHRSINGNRREEIMAKGNNSQRKETKKPKKDKK
jgi:hypothetical protein